jgi:voltage-gated potassium channel Kch
MFYAEQTESNWDKNQQKWFYDDGSENPFNGIPITLWWSIVTITTVGYGDYFPITPAGKTVAALTMLIGILVG